MKYLTLVGLLLSFIPQIKIFMKNAFINFVNHLNQVKIELEKSYFTLNPIISVDTRDSVKETSINLLT